MHTRTVGLVSLGIVTLGVACALPSQDERSASTSSAYSGPPGGTGSTTSTPPPYPVPTASSGFCSPPPQGTTTTTEGDFTVTTMISGYTKTVTRSRSLAEGPVFTFTPATTEPAAPSIRRCYVKNEHETKTEIYSWQCPGSGWRLDTWMASKGHGSFERRLTGPSELVKHVNHGEQTTYGGGGMYMNDERLLDLRDGQFVNLNRHRTERYGATASERLLSFDGTTCTYREDGRIELCHLNGIPMAESWEQTRFPSVAADDRCSRAAIEEKCCETCAAFDFSAGLGSCTLLASRDVPALIE